MQSCPLLVHTFDVFRHVLAVADISKPSFFSHCMSRNTCTCSHALQLYYLYHGVIEAATRSVFVLAVANISKHGFLTLCMFRNTFSRALYQLSYLHLEVIEAATRSVFV
jgi:hypothetical protein